MAGELGSIEVNGLRDLQSALRKIDKELPRELAAGLAEAAKIVADAARGKVPQRTGRAAASIKVRKQQRAASIAMGGAKASYMPWLDFGGKVGRNRSVHRPFIPGGRYVYPTLSDKNEEVVDKIDEVIERLAGRAGFKPGEDD